MKNYMTVWNRWAAAKATIVAQHERLKPLIEKIKNEIILVSGQDISSTEMEIPGLPIKFYPFWEGFAYTYDTGWRTNPRKEENWGWTLAQTEKVAHWMSNLNEEEVKLLFRQWSELVLEYHGRY